MAHKKAGGSTRNGRDSNPQYLGVKRFGGQAVLDGIENKIDPGDAIIGFISQGQGVVTLTLPVRTRACRNRHGSRAWCCS